MKNKSSITQAVRNEFSKKDMQTLNQLCVAVQTNLNLDLDKIDLNHRVRSCLYNLKKAGEIKRIADSTYVRTTYQATEN